MNILEHPERFTLMWATCLLFQSQVWSRRKIDHKTKKGRQARDHLWIVERRQPINDRRKKDNPFDNSGAYYKSFCGRTAEDRDFNKKYHGEKCKQCLQIMKKYQLVSKAITAELMK